MPIYNEHSQTDDQPIDRIFSDMPDEAGKGLRMINSIIDSFTAVFFVGIIYFLTNDVTITNDFVINLAIYFTYAIYYVFLETYFGKTLGKVLTRTKVVDEDGGKPTLKHIIIRTLCRFIPFEAFSFLGQGTGWHDTLSKTRVIKG